MPWSTGPVMTKYTVNMVGPTTTHALAQCDRCGWQLDELEEDAPAWYARRFLLSCRRHAENCGGTVTMERARSSRWEAVGRGTG